MKGSKGGLKESRRTRVSILQGQFSFQGSPPYLPVICHIIVPVFLLLSLLLFFVSCSLCPSFSLSFFIAFSLFLSFLYHRLSCLPRPLTFASECSCPKTANPGQAIFFPQALNESTLGDVQRSPRQCLRQILSVLRAASLKTAWSLGSALWGLKRLPTSTKVKGGPRQTRVILYEK